MMSMRKNNDIWYSLIKGIVAYMREPLYNLNDTGLEVIDIVDFVEKPANSEFDPTYINVNTVGYSFVKKDNSIYDETKTLIRACETGDTFTKDGVSWFIDQEKIIYDTDNTTVIKIIPATVHTLDKKNNNTRVGNAGILLDVGSFTIDEDTDYSTWEIPQVIFMCGLMSDVNMLERNSHTSAKTQAMSMIMLCTEDDLYDGNESGYDKTFEVKSLMSRLLYEHFNASKCTKALGVKDIVGWNGSFDFIAEDRPVVVSILENLLTFR